MAPRVYWTSGGRGGPSLTVGSRTWTLSSLAGSIVVAVSGAITGVAWHGTAIADAYIASASTWNAKDVRRGARGTRLTTQSISDSTDTAVSFTAEVYDTGGFFAPTSTDFTVPSDGAGAYVICASCTFAPGNPFRISIAINGTADEWHECATYAGSHTIARVLAVGDVVTMVVRQETGGSLNLTTAKMSVQRVSA